MPTVVPTAVPTVVPTVAPTAAPTAAPAPLPTQRPTAAPTALPTPVPPVETLAQTVVMDGEEQAQPFELVTAQDQAGEKSLMIVAKPAAGQPDAAKTELSWVLREELIQAAKDQGFHSLTAKRESISVVLEVASLAKETGHPVKVSINKVERAALPVKVQEALAEAARPEEVFQVSVAGLEPDALVHVSFALEAGAQTAAIVAFPADAAEALYPATTVVVDGNGQATAHAMVPNGATCFLHK